MPQVLNVSIKWLTQVSNLDKLVKWLRDNFPFPKHQPQPIGVEKWQLLNGKIVVEAS